ncbi:SIR2 family protein [Bacillus anthracis]|uniref:SIR2 family protein n=1 Tax=Bacillus anthracis TaxID=1392 RepID=UPI00297B09EC|nr:SIR2 family protein [Bacillus anthracis]MCU5430722.1 SIR2 family protein [Bacillus cereus]MEB9455944.1 SIR2 family protein [Bacillus anthracis]
MSLALSQLISKVRKKEVILWAGAGFSMYTNLPTGGQLASKIISELPEQYHEELKYKALPEVAEEFVMLNGGTKRELFRILKEEIDIEPNTLEVHEKLSEIIQIEKIVTTNYDKLFEKAYKNELSVIVNNNQLPLATKRTKLFKVHGDIDQENTMVITTSDYVDFFTSSNRNAAVWKNIEALMNEHSFLFVGYSLDDINVKSLFETMVKNVGEFRHQSFFVSPNLPEHKQQYLRSKGIAYIDMTAEQLVNAIHDEVISNLIKDCEAGFVDPIETNRILKKKGINAKFEIEDEKLKLKSFGAEAPIPFTLKLESSAVSDFNAFLFEDSSREEMEFSQEIIKGLVSSYKGIDLINHQGVAKLKIIKHPDRELDGSFSLKGTNSMLENIKCKSFSAQKEVSIHFQHQSFSLRLKIDTNDISQQAITLTINASGDTLLDYKAYCFLKDWLTQGYELVFNNLTDRNIIPFGDLKSGTIEFKQLKALQDLVTNTFYFYEQLVQIQNHYSVYLTVPEKITDKDVRAIDQIINFIKNNKQKVQDLKLKLNLNEEIKAQIISGEPISCKVFEQEPQEIELFNEKFIIGAVCVEIVDGIITNKEEVLKKIEEKEEFVDIILNSASDEMYFSYQTEPVVG